MFTTPPRPFPPGAVPGPPSNPAAPPILVRAALRVAMPEAGEWHELLNSDAACYGGSGVGNLGRVLATAHPVGGWPASALVCVPPLGTVILSKRPISTIAPNPGEAHARP